MLTTDQLTESTNTPPESHATEVGRGPRLQDLIPIAMVIAAGCEPCAEKMVHRALKEGSSWQDIDKTLRIVASMQSLDCFAKAVGPEAVARMSKPLAAGQRTLQEVTAHAGR